MNLSQLKEQVRNILRERSVKAIQKDYSNVVDDIQKHLELYKKSKGTPEEKKHIGHLKTLGEKKKSLQKELDLAVSGLYKNAELKVDEAITNPKKSNPNDLATTVIGWYDFATDYIDDGGQRRRAIKSNEDVVNWFDSHPSDVKQKAFKVMLSKQPSIKSKIERVFGSKLKEGKSINEFMTPRDIDSKMKELGIKTIPISSQGERVLKGMVKEKFLDKVTNSERLIYFVESLGNEKFGYRSKGKPLSPLVDRFWNDITSEAIFFGGKLAAYQVAMNIKDMKRNGEQLDSPYQMMKEYFKNFGMEHDRSRLFDSAIRNLEEWMKRNKIKESVNEASEPEIISQLKDIVKNKQYQSVKDPKSGKSVKVDMQTANAVLQIYNGLSNVNKENMVKMGLPKMIDVSFKIINKYK